MTIDQRIQRLERVVANQRRLLAAGAAIFAITLLAAGGEHESGLNDFVGGSLVLKRPDGKVWLEAHPNDDGGGSLKIISPKSQSILELSSSDEEQMLMMEKGRLADNSYVPQVLLKAVGRNSQLALLRAPKSVIAYLGAHPDDHGVAFVTDKSGKTTWIAPVGAKKFEESGGRDGADREGEDDAK